MLSGRLIWLLVAPASYFLLFFDLSGMGMVGPDEPRYAAIGREMARSGDWVTPRLRGDPWFEKPALLYWMTGVAFRAGFNEDLAPRVPVATASLLFLFAYFRLLRREFGKRAAFYATLILATCAGWLGFSHIGVTDLPMSAAFSGAMLLGLPWVDRGERRGLVWTGVLLGLAVLAKGLVPLVLALPLVWMGRRRWRDLPPPILGFLVTALPWYLAVIQRHGAAFVNDFFGKHHLERFSADSLMHQQPVWFYGPVLLAGLFPWTAAVVLLFQRRIYEDRRLRFLLLWTLFGFVFFSAATNKLPGYLLPLLPAVAALTGVALATAGSVRWPLAMVGASLALMPLASQLLPAALAAGLSRVRAVQLSAAAVAPFLLLAALCYWWEVQGKRATAMAALGCVVVTGAAWLKAATFPSIDRAVSSRPLWREIREHADQVCIGQMHRSWRYGLNYYSVTPLADCEAAPRPLVISQEPGQPPRLLK